MDRLMRVMGPGDIQVWLNRPLEVLDDANPVEVLARGEYRRVAQLIAELESSPDPKSWFVDAIVSDEWIRV